VAFKNALAKVEVEHIFTKGTEKEEYRTKIMCLDSLIKRPIQGVSLFWKHQNKA
jgi:hypothetical protein